MKTTKVQGAKVVEFLDFNNEQCALNPSSLATKEPCLWLGIVGNRMHLTQKQVKKLLPHLQKFAETGEL